MAVLESPQATWDKRFKQKHYSYRDSESATTLVRTEVQALALFAAESLLPTGPWTVYYPFGYNARNWTSGVAALTAAGVAGSKFAWPQGAQLPDFAESTGDYASGIIGPRNQCYAREVTVYVIEDTWIRFISVNPIYATLLAQAYTPAQITTMGVPQVIVEVEHFIAATNRVTFYPTYGFAIVFRANTAGEAIYISVEGNVEGGE